MKLGKLLLWAHKRVDSCQRKQAKFDAARQAVWKAGGIVGAPPSEEETEADTEKMTLLRVLARLKQAGVPELSPDHFRLLAEVAAQPDGHHLEVTAADIRRGRELEALGLALVWYDAEGKRWHISDGERVEL
jgi:hypothetical protein